MVKHLPAMQESQVWFLDLEYPLEKEMATHSSTLAWWIPWTEELVGYSPWGHKESHTTEKLTHTSKLYFSSLQFCRSVMSDFLQPHELQHARPPCPSPTPGVHPNSCPSSRWSHPAISSSVVPFSSCLQFFPASGSFQMSQRFTSGGQSIGVSASASVLPWTLRTELLLGWTGWITLQSKGLSRVFSNTTVQKHQFFGAQLSLWSNSHIHTWLLEKP